MSDYALLQTVIVEPKGSTLAADATSIIDNQLLVDSAQDFDEEGGTLDLNGTRLQYTSITEGTNPDDPDTIHLADDLAEDAQEDDFVGVVAGGLIAEDWYAVVTMGNDGAEAHIPIDLYQRPQWPAGEYDDPVPVTVSDDLQHLEDAPGRTVGTKGLIGNNVTQSGAFSNAGGESTIADGDVSLAVGDGAHASGYASVAFGFNAVASGYSSLAEGQNTTATGIGSHAEGSNTTASGDYSHAEGNHNTASQSYAHAEGLFTEANGIHSHAEGCRCVADASASHAQGWGAHAFRTGEFATAMVDAKVLQRSRGELLTNGGSTDWKIGGFAEPITIAVHDGNFEGTIVIYTDELADRWTITFRGSNDAVDFAGRDSGTVTIAADTGGAAADYGSSAITWTVSGTSHGEVKLTPSASLPIRYALVDLVELHATS